MKRAKDAGKFISFDMNFRKDLGGNNLEEIMGVLLGSLNLFYPLLIASGITFIYALVKRSWISMLISAISLYPIAWLFSGYPPFPWANFVPCIQIILAIILYFLQKNKSKA